MTTSNNASAQQLLNFSIAGGQRIGMIFLNQLVILIPTLERPFSIYSKSIFQENWSRTKYTF